MARRSLVGFLFLNVVVTFLVTSAIILINESRRSASPQPTRGLLQVVVTATPDPNQTPTIVYIVVTATPPTPGAAIAIQPTPLPGTPNPDLPPLDPSLLPPSLGTLNPPTLTPTDPSGCPTYTIRQGDILGTIAVAYGVSVEDLMRANNLTERDVTRLQIGQVLILPIDGCGLATRTPTPSLTPTRIFTATAPPTSTPAPVVSNAQAKLEVVQIIEAGDITAEGIELRNISGGQIDIGGWTLRDNHGHTFTFPDYSMFEGRRVILYTREGESGPLALYWGLSGAIWGEPDQAISIIDSDGNVQLTYSMTEIATLIARGISQRGVQSDPGFVPTPTRTAAP